LTQDTKAGGNAGFFLDEVASTTTAVVPAKTGTHTPQPSRWLTVSSSTDIGGYGSGVRRDDKLRGDNQ
jgi:hypothetical protein